MTYLSFYFLTFLFITAFVFYLIGWIGQKCGKNYQWIVLLFSSAVFYYINSDIKTILLFLATIFLSYIFSQLLTQNKCSDGIYKNENSVEGISTAGKDIKNNRTLLLIISIFISCLPLLFVKFSSFLVSESSSEFSWKDSIIIPMGLSFYTLQIIAYLSDCYNNKIVAEKNPFKYALFISFFPYIVQGPITRFSEMSDQLYGKHEFRTENILEGLQLMLWGWFLKIMIADKISGSVNLIFDNYQNYAGFYIFIAACLYSIQLYTDFYACVTICQGAAQLFGIILPDNFRRPYFATSIHDFWNRWHITLGRWLKEFIYFPLGGSRKGPFRTYINLIIIFLVSGFWHGNGFQFFVWGLIQGIYQVIERLLAPHKNSIDRILHLREESFSYRLLKRAEIYILFIFSLLPFRAKSVADWIQIMKNMFLDFNPWVIFGDMRYSFGMDVNDWFIFFCAMLVLIFVSSLQERGIHLRKKFAEQHIIVRWMIYMIAIWCMWIFGTYGYGFNAADFIYGGF